MVAQDEPAGENRNQDDRHKPEKPEKKELGRSEPHPQAPHVVEKTVDKGEAFYVIFLPSADRKNRL